MPSVRTEPAPPRLPWLARMPFRRKLALIVGIPSTLALLGCVLALGRVTSTYRRAHILEEANASSSFLIQAAATQAKERGFTAAALSDPTAETTRRAIYDLRAGGDALLDSALTAARDALRGNPVLAAAHARMLDARRARDLKRAAIDEMLLKERKASQGEVQDWFDAQTRLIGAEHIFGSTLFLAQNPYEMVIQYNGFIKNNVFVASEFAGRERARLGRFIASGQPIPAERLEELQRWRGVVEENLAALAQLRANPAMPRPVLRGIGHMEEVFLGDYETVRQSVYAASAHGQPYPLTTDEWIAASTRGIDSILAVSDHIGEEAARISHEQAVFSLFNVLLIVVLMGLMLLAAVASVFVAGHLTRRLEELREAAGRVGRGNYSQPIAQALAPDGQTGDEFARLAGVFNQMQGEVEAGIERLRAEKTGVEAKVRERTRELSESNARLHALNAEKDTFLGICSHDLKNPLSGILGLAGLLRDDPGDPVQVRECAADILRASEFMSHLVGNLLDIGAIEQGKFRLDPAAIDLREAVARGVADYRARAAAKNIRLELAAPEEAVMVVADPRAVTQVVDNLVSNAVKYTPRGGLVEVRVTDAAGAGARAGFAVRDTGPGLSAADQARLFEKYARLSSPVTGGESSTGLGLSIVKKLVEAMGGTVRCESGLGKGSTFAAEFPAA